MSSELSVAQVLASLEAQRAFHKEREEYHAQQEVYHREQRAVHAAEYENVNQHYEAFSATAGGAAEVAARAIAATPQKAEPAPAPPAAPPTPKLPSRLVARLVREKADGEAFTASQVAAEVNRRYRSELRKLLDTRVASTCLRRLLADRKVRRAEQGTAHHQAVYTRA